MAGTLLHITLAEAIAEDPRLPGALRDELAAHGDDFRLGAVLFDLPYLDGLILSGVRLLLEKPLVLNEIGTTLHAVDPAGLLVDLLGSARDPAGRALALGAITHFAVDLVFHPVVCELVAQSQPTPQQRDARHKHIEDQVDLHVSFDRLGHSGQGTAYALEKLGLVPHPSWAGRFVGAATRSSGVGLSERQARRWLRRLHLYALAIGTPHSPFVVTLPEDDPALLVRSLGLAERAVELGVEQVLCAHAILENRRDPRALREILGDFALTDGAAVAPRAARTPTLKTQGVGHRMKKHCGLALALTCGLAVSAMSTSAAAFSPFNPARPGPTALSAMRSDALVNVVETRWYWAFEPQGGAKDVGFIFYQGAFIDERSYAPILRALAEAGYPSFLLKLPHDFAMTAPFLATYVVRDHAAIRSFAVGGHSLGGVVATIYCNHKDGAGDKIDGLALWSSYPSPLDTIAHRDTAVVSLWGTEDGLASAGNIQGSRSKLPADAVFVTIDGGNHAQFGDYGAQDGDNPATISATEQRDQVIEAMLDFLASLE